MVIKQEDGVFSITNKIIAKIVKQEDEYLKRVLMDFAREQSIKYGEEVQLILVDENIAKEVIDLGVQEYLKLHSKEK